MVSYFDTLRTLQSGQAMEFLARQFKLSAEQAQLATEALLPAFGEGLKRKTATASDPMAFMQRLMTDGRLTDFGAPPSQGLTPWLDTGNEILAETFGSKELSRAVAAQAAQATGIGAQVLQQMLPVLATLVVGSLMKSAASQTNSTNPFADWMERWIKIASPGANTSRRSDPVSNLFAVTPWGQVMDGFMRGMTPEPAERAATNPSGRPRTPYDDLFAGLFETGRETRDDYQRKTEALFDTFFQGMSGQTRR